MGTKFSRNRKQIHDSRDEPFKGIKAAHELEDVLCVRWILSSKHKSALHKSLQRYNAGHIASVIIRFLPSVDNDNTLMLPVKAFEKSEDAQTVYHAFFRANIFAIYNDGKAPSEAWRNSVRTGSYGHSDSNVFPMIRIVVMGDGGVGKSALTIRHITNQFSEYYDPTIEDSYRRTLVVNPNEKDIDSFEVPKAHKIEGKNENGEKFQSFALDILDTAGKEEFSSMQDQWIREGDLFLICFAVNNKRSFDDAKLYRERILRCKDEEFVPIIFVGTKCDLRTVEDEQMVRQEHVRHRDTRNDFVDPQEVIEKAREWDVPYIETSAKHGRNVHFLFRAAVYECWWIWEKLQSFHSFPVCKS